MPDFGLEIVARGSERIDRRQRIPRSPCFVVGLAISTQSKGQNPTFQHVGRRRDGLVEFHSG